MSDNNNQLTTATGYDTSRMIFSEPVNATVPDSKPPIMYKRVNIATKNEDGSVGDLILPTENCFSFGLNKNTSPEGKCNGYSLPLCLHTLDGATQNEKEWVNTFNNIVEKSKDYLIDNKEELEQYELERNDIKKLNPLYYKKDKGKIVDGSGPVLYAKIIKSRKHDKIITTFFDFNGESIDPLSLLTGNRFTCKAAIKIESIYIGGTKISLQVKLYECEIKPLQSSMPRLLRPQANTRVLTQTSYKSLPNSVDDDDEGSVKADDEDDEVDELQSSMVNLNVEEDKKPAPKKRVVRRVVRKGGVQ
jgi:hypothetical protein